MEPEIEQPEMVQEEKIVICNGEFQFPDGATYGIFKKNCIEKY